MSADLSNSDYVLYAAAYIAHQQGLTDKEAVLFLQAELQELASIGDPEERASFVLISREIVVENWFNIDLPF